MSEPQTERIDSDPTTAAPWTPPVRPPASWSANRLVARLLTPVLAVVPWMVTLAGGLMLSQSVMQFQVRLEGNWTLLIGGTLVLLLGALLWAALTAWSSVGTTVAGMATIIVGLLAYTQTGMRAIYEIGIESPLRLQWPLIMFVDSMTLILIGSLLLAAGLGAAGARRVGRRAA